MNNDNDFWDNKLKAFLHDPPDKSLKIMGHEERAKEILRAIELEWDEKFRTYDTVASSVQRVNIRYENKILAIDFYAKSWGNYYHAGYPEFKHPITAGTKEYSLVHLLKHLKSTYGHSKLDEFIEDIQKAEKETLKELWEVKESPQLKYMLVWSRYPEKLCRKFEDVLENWKAYLTEIETKGDLTESLANELTNLPAETRFPDHSIWSHLDFVSALTSVKDPALFRFKISPVQSFISNARKEKDLWASSHLLSLLTFEAIKVIVNKYGPDALIYPHLRGQAIFETVCLGIEDSDPGKLKIASTPNKFLAVISYKDEEKIKEEVTEKVNELLKEIYNSAWDYIIGKEGRERYEEFLFDYFKVSAVALSVPRKFKSYKEVIEFLKENGIIQDYYEKWFDLLDKISEYKNPKEFDLYPLMFSILDELVNQESSRFEKIEQSSGYKCSQCGENLAIKEKPKRLMKEKELLCPICLVKRYYSEWVNKQLGIEVAFESVSEVALRKGNWLQKVENTEEYKEFVREISKKFTDLVEGNKITNPEFLYLESWTPDYLRVEYEIEASNEELEDFRRIIRDNIYKAIGNPEKYYSILIMDGDEMGKLITGQKIKNIRDYVHSFLQQHYDDIIKDTAKNEPELEERLRFTQRLVSPPLHVAINRTLTYFSVNKVPEIVEKNNGTLIYAGGDDVLALLPVDTALKAAYEIEKIFETDWDGWKMLPGRTMSSGLLIVHYKHPLYDALDKARNLERKAKNFGREAMAVGQLKRSGDYREAILNWNIYEKIENPLFLLINSKREPKKIPNLSEKILYDVVKDAEMCPDNEEAVKELLKYELSRHYNTNAKEEEKKREINQLLESINDISKGLRVILNQQEIDEAEIQLIGDLKTLNRELNNAIKENRCPEEVLESFFSTKDLPKVLSIIMKKQIKGTFNLLKILLECAEVEE